MTDALADARSTGKRLGKRAKRLFEQADDHKCAIYIPTFALVEAGEACRKGQVTLSLQFKEWTRLALASGKYHEAPLTAEVVCVAQGLYAIPGRGDRLIAATAAALGCRRRVERSGRAGSFAIDAGSVLSVWVDGFATHSDCVDRTPTG